MQRRKCFFTPWMVYSGRYRLEGDDCLIANVDSSWHPAWIESGQMRFFKLDGETLSLSSPYQDHPKFPGARVCGVVIWRKENWIDITSRTALLTQTNWFVTPPGRRVAPQKHFSPLLDYFGLHTTTAVNPSVGIDPQRTSTVTAFERFWGLLSQKHREQRQ